jgi:lipoprotein-anchoring transpeptidase ErfK/SrfK
MIGKPMSAGCVLMRNTDIIELYDEVRTGDLVWIGD